MARLVQVDRKATETQNHALQPRSAEEHLWTHNTSSLEACGQQQQKTHQCHSCQLRTGNRGYSHRLTKIGQNIWGETLSGLMSLDFCCDIQLMISCPSLYCVDQPIFWSSEHFTKLKSSQNGFLNMAVSSLYSNGLHGHQISNQ